MKLDAALAYAELGYAVFPCVPNEKRPLTSNGLLDATTDAEQIAGWWERWPDANVAIATNGLLVIDLDVDDQGEPNQWLADQPERLIELAAAPLSLTPRGGKHFIFRQPPGVKCRNTASKLAPHVDTRADGGYILVPPSMAGGRPYRWGGERLDCTIDKLPEPPLWLFTGLTGGQIDTSVRVEAPTEAEKIPPGQRNDALARIAGSMRRIGMTEGEIRAALRRVNSDRCTPPLDESEVDKIAWSVGRYTPDSLSVAIVHNHYAQDFVGERSNRPEDPGQFPMELLEVPGFLGEVSRFCVETAIKPQPILATAAALALLATLTGRKIRDQYGTRTNLYVLGVGPSACGKEYARQVNKEILYGAGLDKLIGGESAASSTGLVNAVARQPAILFQWDEIGRLLKTMGDARNPHLFHIQTVLMKLFSSSQSVYVGDVYADQERNVSIVQPCACLYATTVPQSFYESLTAESITDGFLSRLLVFETVTNPDEADVDRIPPPKDILDVAKFWGQFQSGGNLSSQHPDPACVSYTNAAIAAMQELRHLAQDERRKALEPFGTLWTRLVEKTRKLALLFAASERQAAPVIDVPAVQWAGQLCVYLTRRMIFIADRWIAENRTESTSKRLERLIPHAPGITKLEFIRLTRWMTARERDEHLAALQASGLVQIETIATGGRPRTVITKV